jgi:hypothetical protein
MEGLETETRQDTLYWQHPVMGPAPRLSDQSVMVLCKIPRLFDSNWVWMDFRAQMAERAAMNPEHPGPRFYMEEVDKVLAWRATVPEHLQFWEED